MDGLSPVGHVEVIIGPMFSGKTTELIRRLRRYQVAKYRCLIVNHATNTSYGSSDVLATHDLQSLPAKFTDELTSLKNEAREYDVIGVDEGQFFPDVATFAEEMANSGAIVLVAALDATYERRGFENVLNLIPIAESVVKLSAICMKCFEDAAYTRRLSDETDVDVVRGTDKYNAVCRFCHRLDSDRYERR